MVLSNWIALDVLVSPTNFDGDVSEPFFTVGYVGFVGIHNDSSILLVSLFRCLLHRLRLVLFDSTRPMEEV